jgi:hypothetical protein
MRKIMERGEGNGDDEDEFMINTEGKISLGENSPSNGKDLIQ